ncbi:MAG: hypothetical protein KGM24_10425, partial [Elusimicrobia bacterium]|nr:hypothetical protein [Elusimicrobiota bacterium]
MRLALVLTAALAATPALAARDAVRLKGGPKAEDVLRRFVETSPALKARLAAAAARESALLADARAGLRDSVAAAP